MIKRLFKKIIHPSTRKFLRNIQTKILKLGQPAYYRMFRGLAEDILVKRRLLLNIACGKLIRQGWVNVDILPEKGAYFLDLEKKFPFDDGQIRHIHCEHFLEHMDYSMVELFFKECHRTLEPGGTIRMILPDAGKYFKAYCEDDAVFFEKVKNLGGSVEPFRTPIEIINQMCRMGGEHRFAWDFQTLELNLRAAGFVNIERSKLGDMPSELNIDGIDYWRPLESLYVNAAKPKPTSR